MKRRITGFFSNIADRFSGILVLILPFILIALELLDVFYTPRTNIILWLGLIELAAVLVIGIRALWKRRKSAKKESSP